ncbi:MAG TPA: response regulator transcription factor [Clostridia bacterium]|nr:response regulator transcription factor [Clostridia bacterium]
MYAEKPVAGTRKTRGWEKDATARQVWLVDDSRKTRELLRDMVGADPAILIEREFDCAETMLTHLAIAGAPEVILMDIQMGGMSGLETLKLVRTLAPGTAVVIMTAFFDGQWKQEALENGAAAFLLKSAEVDAFVRALRQARPGAVTARKAATTTTIFVTRASVGMGEAPSCVGWTRLWLSGMRLLGRGVMSNLL